MTAAKPIHLVPKLRFPKFRDIPAWSSSHLDSVCEVLNKRRVPITKKDRKAGPFPYYGASGIVDYVDDYIFDERLILVGEDGAKWGPFEQTAFIADGKCWVNNHAHVLRSVSLIDSLLEAYLVRSDLGRYVTGTAPPKLTLAKLKTIPIPVPSSPAEQQKIADCLGSLDDLIAAEDRKLEALRQHKQGLMQQLFPQPGETQPILRFPEFRDSAGWQKVSLSCLLTFQNGYPFSSSNFGEERLGLRLIRNRDLRSEDRVVYYDGHPLPDFIVNDGDLLVGMDGDFTPCVWHKGTGLLNQRVGRILPRGKGDLRFLGYLLEIHLKVVQEDTARTTVKHLSSRTVEGMVVHAPNPDEQQHIANGLSALDICIHQQVAKLDAIQMHKQGLLQQLFPSLEGQ